MTSATFKPFRLVKARAVRFRRARRPIVVFALRRGGSTMVAEAIAASRGVWFVNEPYAVQPIRPGYALRLSRLPPALHSQLFHLKGEDLVRFESYTRDLLEARIREFGGCRRTRPILRSDRVCLKVLNAPWMIDWFQEHTDAHLLALLRHPGAQALSVMRQNWRLSVEAYLARRTDLEEFFSVAQLDFASAILTRDDLWRKAVLDWVVTSHPLRQTRNPDIIRIRYEDVVLDPGGFVDRVLVGLLGLDDGKRMAASFSRPSGSSRMSERTTLEAIESGRRSNLVEGWRQYASLDMCRAAQEILDRFEVTEYSFMTSSTASSGVLE